MGESEPLPQEPTENVRRDLGRYELVAHLASGGMAEVFLARLRDNAKPVCIKRVLPEFAHDEAYRQMFLNEGKLALLLRHPNLIAATELAEDNEQPFLVMDYVDGETLASVQRRFAQRGDRLPEHMIAYIMRDAAAGLHAAHTLLSPDGEPLMVVHRDVSPQNILVGYDGRVRVIDFGVANARTSIPHIEGPAVKGKFGYMAPEQLEGGALDARTDIFGLGVVLYELLTSARLYPGDDPLEMLKTVCLRPIVRPRDLVPVHEDLDRATMRSLEKSRNDRFATAQEFCDAMAPFVADETRCREDLSALMHREFAARLAQKNELVHGALPPGDTILMRPRISSMPVTAPRDSSSRDGAREVPSYVPSLQGPTNSDPPTSVVARKKAEESTGDSFAYVKVVVAVIVVVLVLWRLFAERS